MNSLEVPYSRSFHSALRLELTSSQTYPSQRKDSLLVSHWTPCQVLWKGPEMSLRTYLGMTQPGNE